MKAYNRFMVHLMVAIIIVVGYFSPFDSVLYRFGGLVAGVYISIIIFFTAQRIFDKPKT